MSGWGWFILVVILLIPIGIAGWIFYARFRAKQNGLPPPPVSSFIPFAKKERHTDVYPASSGPISWVKTKVQSLRGSGGASRPGAYEQPLGTGGRRGLDPDEAWDARVGAEADGYGAGGYYEEQELGLRPPGGGPYGGSGYGGQAQALPEYGEERERGRSLSREGPYIGGNQRGLDARYDEELDHDPFGDEAERSELRGVSPRPQPEGGSQGHGKQGSGGGHDDSPTERRSMFHENV